ncbi:hypothetical protein M408DRAFT_26105 [Serendipita vermifera MAFF 305830]|uniref:Uncharacterized protein n=1 Tax=Serendipita vermifera MAFF 305830 TaxID=933852 RepID=A0A0C3ALV0_SERVB|nr:hypothetical protein M408DRAFT_26105 [Serendipita vermifera MAFF 305830]
MVNTYVLASITLLLSTVAFAAPQNTTFDDQDFARITYTNPNDWQHYPLEGYETLFYNGSRSYTYVLGAYATFTFIGTGIYFQGPYANDQAKRRVILDGEEVGVFTAYAPNRAPSAVFWGTRNLLNANHTVVVSHNDTATEIFAMDAWIVETDPEATISPPSTGTAASSPSLQIEGSAGAGTLASAGSYRIERLGITTMAVLAYTCLLLLTQRAI